MRLVVLESPYAGDIVSHTFYARRAVKDSLRRGEAPIASHLLYTQAGILDDDNPTERLWGITAGHEWFRVCDAVVFYMDFGMSRGMNRALDLATSRGLTIERREIGRTE